MGTASDMGGATETKSSQMISRKEAAEVVYKDLKEAERSTFEVASGYGRWLIASLVLMHGGGLVGVFSLLKDAFERPAILSAMTAAVVWLLAGLLLALACGFSTWLNWSYIAKDYGHMADPQMLWNPDAWARAPIHGRGIAITYWVSIGLGVLSALCPVGAAWSLVCFAQGAI